MNEPSDTTGQLLRALWLPIAAMVVVVVVSNIAVQYPINDWITWGALTYPVAFLVTDLTNRRFGVGATRRVVYVGFAIAVVLSIWASGPRIAIASGSAFLAAQLLDVLIFDRLRRSEAWWRAPLVSSLSASALDTALFFSIAFAGTGLPWVTWGLGDFGVKVAMALALLIPFRAMMGFVSPSALETRRTAA
ncbi:MAG: hypothetical protein CL569_05765 [Alphaproteobacteria bacterium]|nr:hypothetical protein [Alphaproteobacteria bacterium]|tara:strand:+ start:731 stop:1303 length:573 start_codon:yes stop_codon:yes gene_type:complete